jgi:opacity protein-like surface antigen
MKKFVLALVVLATAASLSPASATLYDFMLSGPQTAAFEIESSTPTSYTLANPAFDLGQVHYDSVQGTFAGVSQVASVSFGQGFVYSIDIGGRQLSSGVGLVFSNMADPSCTPVQRQIHNSF